MSSKRKGIACIIASAFFFALMNVFVRLSGDLPSAEKSFFRNLVALAFAAVILLKNHQSFFPARKHLGLLILRASFGTVGILANFYAVDHLFLADASAIQKLVPFITIAASFFILHEKIRPFQLLCIGLAFAASLMVVKPSFHNLNLIPSLVAVVGAFGAGIAYTLVRRLTLGGVDKAQIIFFFSAFSCVAVIPLILLNFQVPTMKQLILLLMAGLAASGGQFAVTYAYSYAPASQISIFDYSQILFSALFGLFLFDQIPDALSFAGYALIMAAALLNYWFQTKKAD